MAVAPKGLLTYAFTYREISSPSTPPLTQILASMPKSLRHGPNFIPQTQCPVRRHNFQLQGPILNLEAQISALMPESQLCGLNSTPLGPIHNFEPLTPASRPRSKLLGQSPLFQPNAPIPVLKPISQLQLTAQIPVLWHKSQPKSTALIIKCSVISHATKQRDLQGRCPFYHLIHTTTLPLTI